MRLRTLRAFLALVLFGVATASHALVFAVNEGVTYRVTNDEIRAKYAGLAADLSKLLKQPVAVEPIGDCPTLRKGLETKSTTSPSSTPRISRCSPSATRVTGCSP